MKCGSGSRMNGLLKYLLLFEKNQNKRVQDASSFIRAFFDISFDLRMFCIWFDGYGSRSGWYFAGTGFEIDHDINLDEK
jgi:hypothetical protein